MLSSIAASISGQVRSSQRVKSLENGPRDDAKTPEVQPEPVENDVFNIDEEEEATNSKQQSDAKESSLFSLSSRASAIKQSINEHEVASAIILKPDGTAEQIEYNTSSKQANKILNGRPTIVGELEGLQVVIVRSLDQENGSAPNQNVLPAPFSNKAFNGNYLLYRVGPNGNSLDLSLKEYEEFVADNQAQTDQARKNNVNPVENQEIRAHPQSLSMTCLQSEIDREVRAAFKAENGGQDPSESEIAGTIQSKIQQIVNEVVGASNPMNDPDYDPEEDEDDSLDAQGPQQSTQESQSEDARDWRLQLNDALVYVRERGRLDGRVLAEKIAETFYELNGVEPTLNELSETFSKIRSELAEEAIDDVEDGGFAAYKLAKSLSAEIKNASSVELVDYATKIVAANLVSQGKAEFVASNGRTPTNQELRDNVERFALELAEKAISSSQKQQSTASKDSKTSDPDYNPNNKADQFLAQIDELEDEGFDDDNFELSVSSTTKSRTGIAEKYDVYFEQPSDGKREEENLSKAIESFKMRNRREPDVLEVARLKQFISKPASSQSQSNQNEAKENDEVAVVSSKVLVTPVKKKKSAARYNVYFGAEKKESSGNEGVAIKWFQRFNSRNPTDSELGGIRQFIAADKVPLIECEYNVSSINDGDSKQDENENDEEPSNGYIRGLRAKNDGKSTKFTVQFDDDKKGDTNQAVEWFKRFNNRDPTDAEQERINQFIQDDTQNTVETN